tara:strand:- start:1748 stop:1960 length:213 start_codon:yes stop_codon:yes gene_type:complete
MHQRPGKTYKAAAFDGPEKISTKALVEFFKQAEEDTDGDVSFYMGQLAEYFRDQYSPRKGLEPAHRVLGL